MIVCGRACVWLWGVLSHERHYLKTPQSEGTDIRVRTSGASVQLAIEAYGAEMLDLLGVPLILEQ